jgi:hypothetical protein
MVTSRFLAEANLDAIGGLILKSFSLWLTPPKMDAKVVP